MSLITEDLVVLDLTGADRHEATRVLAEAWTAGRVTDLDTFLADVRAREDRWRPACPAASASRTPAARRHRALAGLRPRHRRHRLGRQGRPGHPGLPHRRRPRAAARTTSASCPSSPAG